MLPIVQDTPPASVDELLLELMDLVTLALPRPLTHMVVRFVPHESGRYPAITDVDGRAAPDAPDRIELGHGDTPVLDAINDLVREISEATLREGRIRVLQGRIEAEPTDDGGRHVILVDSSNADDEKAVMTRLFSRDELAMLLFTPQLYAALAHTAADVDKQRAAVDEQLRGARTFDIDMKKGTITFLDAARQKLRTYAFQLIGSWLDDNKRFLHGWANDQVEPRLTRLLTSWHDAHAHEVGLRALLEGALGGPEAMFERFARHVVAQTDAVGVYRAPFSSRQGKGAMFLALLPDT